MVQSRYSYTNEEIMPYKLFTNSLNLNNEERHMLAELGTKAKIIAPYLGKALTSRIQQFASLDTGYLSSAADMQFYLQDWFLQLFLCREEKYIGFQEYFSPIPTSLVFVGIDMILAYGHKVTQFSINPEMATEAFYKALAIKTANDQFRTQVEESLHFSELILLD